MRIAWLQGPLTVWALWAVRRGSESLVVDVLTDIGPNGSMGQSGAKARIAVGAGPTHFGDQWWDFGPAPTIDHYGSRIEHT
jgi:hypothetical protein